MGINQHRRTTDHRRRHTLNLSYWVAFFIVLNNFSAKIYPIVAARCRHCPPQLLLHAFDCRRRLQQPSTVAAVNLPQRCQLLVRGVAGGGVLQALVVPQRRQWHC